MNEIPFYAAANLTRDPELRTTADGKSVARLSLAVTPRRREEGAWVDGTTTFLDATVWGDQAVNVSKSLHKGDRVIVTGRLETRIYTPTKGQNAGQEVRKLEVVVDERLQDARCAQTKVLLEIGVFGGDDRLPHERRDVVVGDDDAALGGELANHLAIAREQAGDGARTVVVEGADLGQVVGEREQHAAQGAEQGGDDEKHRQACLSGNGRENTAAGPLLLLFHVEPHSN